MGTEASHEEGAPKQEKQQLPQEGQQQAQPPAQQQQQQQQPSKQEPQPSSAKKNPFANVVQKKDAPKAVITSTQAATSTSPTSATTASPPHVLGEKRKGFSNVAFARHPDAHYNNNISGEAWNSPACAPFICLEEMPTFKDPFARFPMGIPPWPSLREKEPTPAPKSTSTSTTTKPVKPLPQPASKGGGYTFSKTSVEIAQAKGTSAIPAAAANPKKRAAGGQQRGGTAFTATSKNAAARIAAMNANFAGKTTASGSDGNSSGVPQPHLKTGQRRNAALAGHRRRRGSLLTSWSPHLTYDWSELLPPKATTGSVAWNALLREQVLRQHAHAFPQVPQLSAVECLGMLQPRLLPSTILPPEESPIHDIVHERLPAAKRRRVEGKIPSASPMEDDEEAMEVEGHEEEEQEEDEQYEQFPPEVQGMAKLYKTMMTQETDTFHEFKRREYQYMKSGVVKERMAELASETASLAAREARIRQTALKLEQQGLQLESDEADQGEPSKAAFSLSHYQKEASKLAGHWAETDRQPLDRAYWSEQFLEVLADNPFEVRCLSEADVY